MPRTREKDVLKYRRYGSLIVLAVCVTAALVFRRFVFVAWYPVGMSAFLACAFGLSLFGRRSLCETLAETLPPHVLPPGAAGYCRKLTAIWCLTLVLNGGVALATVFGPKWMWFAWNCVLSYGVMGALVLGERLVRRRVFAVTFHTSGSTATPKTIVKTFASLAEESVYHRDHTLAGVLSAKPMFLATIDPAHLYGKLWRVLLPQVASCPVDPEIILTPESLLAKMATAERVVLVTTPSFLERFCAYAGQYEVPLNTVAIVTSGALLTATVSAAARRVFGCVPTEIFGSTETGGIAWRRQDGSATGEYDWTLFSPVRATLTEGRLTVTSPFACERRFVMGDGAEMAPDRRHFKLLGRLDRLVKIAEERVSLPEMEEKMGTVPGVRAAALVPLNGAHGTVLGAVVVPDFTQMGTVPTSSQMGTVPKDAQMGTVPREGMGTVPCLWGVVPDKAFCKRALALALRRQLAPIFPKGTVPRRYRFVHALPRNAQGKIRSSALRALFATRVEAPFVLWETCTPAGWRGRLALDPEAPYFEGHFPSSPILPGVAQLDIVRRFLEDRLGSPIRLTTVKKMKFTRVIRPTDRLDLELTLTSANETAYVISTPEGETCASGVFAYER